MTITTWNKQPKDKKKKVKKIKQISDKRKQRLEEGGGENITFEKLRNTRLHHCEICGKFIDIPRAWCFSHILSKKDYPQYRNILENIKLVCSIECHEKNDKLWTLEKKRIFAEYLYKKYNKCRN